MRILILIMALFIVLLLGYWLSLFFTGLNLMDHIVAAYTGIEHLSRSLADPYPLYVTMVTFATLVLSFLIVLTVAHAIRRAG